jgi:hypothetical protein
MALTQSYTGRSVYGADVANGTHRLFVAVTCQIGTHPDRFDGLLDPAAEWCVLTPRIARDLSLLSDTGEGDTRLHSRFGTITGDLIRIPLIFPSVEGEKVTVDATWFVSADWPGPLVIGWKGCLERLRFALDPGDESFYFGELNV